VPAFQIDGNCNGIQVSKITADTPILKGVVTPFLAISAAFKYESKKLQWLPLFFGTSNPLKLVRFLRLENRRWRSQVDITYAIKTKFQRKHTCFHGPACSRKGVG